MFKVEQQGVETGKIIISYNAVYYFVRIIINKIIIQSNILSFKILSKFISASKS